MNNPYTGTEPCTEIDPEFFFPTSIVETKKALPLAKAICNACPTFAACRAYADNTVGLQGIWAGKVYEGTGYKSLIGFAV